MAPLSRAGRRRTRTGRCSVPSFAISSNPRRQYQISASLFISFTPWVAAHDHDPTWRKRPGAEPFPRCPSMFHCHLRPRHFDT